MWKLNAGKGALCCDSCEVIIEAPFHPDELDWSVQSDLCPKCSDVTTKGKDKSE